MIVDVLRRAALHHAGLVHNDNAVSHGKGFVLIVGHHNGGEAQFTLNTADFLTQGESDLGIQGAQRLV